MVGTLHVRVKEDANEQLVLKQVHQLFSPLFSDLTIQVQKYFMNESSTATVITIPTPTSPVQQQQQVVNSINTSNNNAPNTMTTTTTVSQTSPHHSPQEEVIIIQNTPVESSPLPEATTNDTEQQV